MSWIQGPIDPPPPHPNLEVRTRSFYGAHNALPLQFQPPCHHGDDAVVQVYEFFGDAGRLFFRCPHYEVYIFHIQVLIHVTKCLQLYKQLTHFYSTWTSDCGFTYWIDGPMEVLVQEYIRHLHVLNQQKDVEINMKHDQINQLLLDNLGKSTMAERITQLEEELRQERAKNLTRRFMPPTVSRRQNYYGQWRCICVTTLHSLSVYASLFANPISTILQVLLHYHVSFLYYLPMLQQSCTFRCNLELCTHMPLLFVNISKMSPKLYSSTMQLQFKYQRQRCIA